MDNLENINKKLKLSFGSPLLKREHLTNLTYSALSNAIYGSSDLNEEKSKHIMWLIQNFLRSLM